jgi:Tfp pilus assembly protein FimT
MMTSRLSALLAEPNHRQRLALERIEFAVGELATALLSCARSRATAQEAIQYIRKAVGPVVAEITTTD